MTSPSLRRIRILFSLLVLILTLSIFWDFRQLIPEGWKSAFLFLQFTPSLLRFINLPEIAGAGFVIVIVLTLITGRSYCSFLCPLGVMQDGISRAGGMVSRRNRRYRYSKPHSIMRYSLLGATVLVFLAGSVFLVTLLDPYSIFGRLATYFGKPVLLVINNLLASLLKLFDSYIIYKLPIRGAPAVTYLIPLSFAALIGILSFLRGRLFCNTVCPVGTLLGLISKVSILKVRIDHNECTMCGRCSISCKSSCIDIKNDSIDLSRCVTCFNCLDACNDNAISYGFKKPAMSKSVGAPVDHGKRRFIISSLAIGASLAGMTKGQDTIVPDTSGQEPKEPKIKVPVPKLDSTVPEEKNFPVSPPGAISIEHFNDYCTACSLCVSACPQGVLRPSVREYGLAGIMQPRMDYHKSYCTFECTICIDICPTGALMPLALEAKKLTQIGKTTFIKDNCIVKTEKTDCGACSEHCPTKAVKMIPYEGNLVIPEVTNKYCIGCGACEHACPTKPYKAIYVDGSAVHADAEKQPVEEKTIKQLEEFPF